MSHTHFSFRMHAPISSNLDFDVEDEQELPKVTTRNTPISMGTTSMAKDPNPQPPTEPNHLAPAYTPSGRTSKVSKNLDFETNYIDPTTAMTATESNVLSQTDKNHPLPSSSAQPVTERSISTPLDDTHQMNETITKGNDVDNVDAKPPQPNTIEDSVPNSIDVESEKAAEITPNLTPKPEQNEGSNTDLGAGMPSTTQENLIDKKPKTEETQEAISVSTAANSGTQNNESTGKPSVSAEPSLNTPISPSSSVQPPTNTDEINKPESTPTIGENKSEAIPESKADSGKDATEKSASPDQSESTKPQSEVITIASPKNEPAVAPTNAVTESIATPSTSASTPTNNDNEHIQETSPPKASTPAEHVNAEISSSNPVKNEINEINQNVKEAIDVTAATASPPASSQPNTKDDTNESTNDKIIDETENASTALVSSIKLILLGCLMLMSYNHVGDFVLEFS